MLGIGFLLAFIEGQGHVSRNKLQCSRPNNTQWVSRTLNGHYLDLASHSLIKSVFGHIWYFNNRGPGLAEAKLCWSVIAGSRVMGL